MPEPEQTMGKPGASVSRTGGEMRKVRVGGQGEKKRSEEEWGREWTGGGHKGRCDKEEKR